MVRDLDLTSVIALHDLNLAAMYCDRIVVLEAGRIHACGTPEAVLTPELLKDVFRVSAHVDASADAGRPHIRFSAG